MTCKGCTGTCCTGIGSEPCTCPDKSEDDAVFSGTETEYLDHLRKLREELKGGHANGRPVSPGQAAREIRDLNRQITALEQRLNRS